MKKFLLFMITLPLLGFAQTVVWSDNFESYDDFIISDIGGWTLIDNDGGTTWGSVELDFTNQGYVGSAIIFNLSAATPDDPSADNSNYGTFEGSKGMYFFASGAGGSTTPNDDWAITPQITLTNSNTFSFQAKSLTDLYGLERIAVGISTTGTAPSDFTILSSGAYIQVPTTWTEFTYDLSAYDGQTVYLAIHYVSNDSFLLQMDDFKVTDDVMSVKDINTLSSTVVYPNPVKDSFTVKLSEKFNAESTTVSLSDVSGKTVQTFVYADNFDVSSLAKGVYIVTITDGTQTENKKLIKK